VAIVDDAIHESDESFSVNLSGLVNGFGDLYGDATIVNDDIPALSISDATVRRRLRLHLAPANQPVDPEFSLNAWTGRRRTAPRPPDIMAATAIPQRLVALLSGQTKQTLTVTAGRRQVDNEILCQPRTRRDVADGRGRHHRGGGPYADGRDVTVFSRRARRSSPSTSQPSPALRSTTPPACQTTGATPAARTLTRPGETRRPRSI
jgi:hypothetical protein